VSEIRQLPEQAERVETGAVQFGNDWPGVFIRGDNAGWYALQLQAFLKDPGDADALVRSQLRGLADLLSGCVVGPAKDLFKND
jgi:hypothetical protein